MRNILILLAALLFFGCQGADGDTSGTEADMHSNNTDIATLAGGCFWCVESDLEKLDGVIEVVSGYAGGSEADPTYEEVGSGNTGHREAVQVHFDPARISYGRILDVFWRHFDPTDATGSFGDRGSQYTSAIFYHNEAQRLVAEQSKKKLQDSGLFDDDIATPIVEFTNFYKAEDYHQDYYKTHPVRYKTYRHYSGRDQFIKEQWGEDPLSKGPLNDQGQAAPRTSGANGEDQFVKPSDAELRKRLTAMQFKVTQQEGTEPPFDNAYWDNKRAGIYVDVVSGEPLFSSTNKYKSGTGWPSFDRPLVEENIVEHKDRSLFMTRVEVRSRLADSHLGHVFNDGPPSTGLRYCLNSAALRFVPADELEEEGYGEFSHLFK